MFRPVAPAAAPINYSSHIAFGSLANSGSEDLRFYANCAQFCKTSDTSSLMQGDRITIISIQFMYGSFLRNPLHPTLMQWELIYLEVCQISILNLRVLRSTPGQELATMMEFPLWSKILARSFDKSVYTIHRFSFTFYTT